MGDNVRFNPEQKSLVFDPLKDSVDLKYKLDGLAQEISREELRVKYAFSAKCTLKNKDKKAIQKLLAEITKITRFSLSTSPKGVVLVVPLENLDDARMLPQLGTVAVPLSVTVSRKAAEEEAEQEWKCEQTLKLITAEVPPKEKGADDEQEEPEAEDNTLDISEIADSAPTKKTKSKDKDPGHGHADEGETEGDGESETEDEVQEKTLYSGLMAIDYGTSNSTVSVRDPSLASEEVRGQLGAEQWQSLCEWINLWLSEHLAPTEPTQLDNFVQTITSVIPQAEIPPCGSPKSEITEALNRMDDKSRVQILNELLGRLSSYPREGSDVEIMRILSGQTLEGFEAVIDSQNLESQRYFVLELDKNIGPGPIPSVLQVVHAPITEDPQALTEDTQLDMGARVTLLLRNAALGEGDIRQFVLSAKRYFGRNETMNVIPADADGQIIKFPADVLVRLSYKELFNRAMADIHKRAEEGKFQDAHWPKTVVSTFPTTYPAALRKQLRDMLIDLDLKEIDTRFDEATAAALYYIWREIGADPVCGMHGLMARSRKDKYGRSYQNILLYDLGGGTTDVALIQLLYEEVIIFEEGEDRGNGGNYFRITPRLLGSTGDRYLGGDLITLWVFRFLKSKLADLLLTRITEKNLEAPMGSPVGQLLNDLPEDLSEKGGDSDNAKYRSGSLLEWTLHPAQYLKDYNRLNDKVIDVLIPTRFASDFNKAPNFFTLWEITDELKKTLGTPIIEHFGTCLGTGLASNWPDDAELDSGQLYSFVQNIQPWLIEGGHITQDDLRLIIKQEEMNQVIWDVVYQSVSLAASLAKARLITENRRDRVDRLILAGLSCNMQVVQDVAQKVFRESDGVFDYDPANVRFDRNSAKTSVAMGACIGRYMESVRIDPFNEKTRQMLRDGYDQIELVIENLFSYLPCRIAYDSLVAMVPIFEQGQELNVKSYWDQHIVARTSFKDLRPVQEKFWVYRIDFPGAEPQYLGLINAERLAFDNDIQEFRKFREEYMVGFEADAELLVRAFFLPKGQNLIVAKDFADPLSGEPHPEIVSQTESANLSRAVDKTKAKPQDDEEPEGEEPAEPEEIEGEEPAEVEGEKAAEKQPTKADTSAKTPVKPQDGKTPKPRPKESGEEESGPTYVMNRTITVKEILEDIPMIRAGEVLRYKIQYPDGTTKACCISNAMHIRHHLEFCLEDADSDPNAPKKEEDRNIIAEFEIDEDTTDELTLVCDQDGRLIVMTKCLFEITIWAEIQYEAQKLDYNYDPFCGLH